VATPQPSQPSPEPCGWIRAYNEAPEVFNAFAAAEDPDGLATRKLRGLTDFEGKEGLEIGCGTGRFTSELARNFACSKLWACDSAPLMLEWAKGACADLDVEFSLANAMKLPHKTQSVDFVFASWVFAYLPITLLEKCLKECHRVLRPCGEIWALESGDAGQLGAPMDGNIHGLLDIGFEIVASVNTELRFPSETLARETLNFLMESKAPAVQGCSVPHQILILKQSRN
jgi:ubiquinone/menaquinone biosynthesis C-methylase UbiE